MLEQREDDNEKTVDLSFYRHITGLYISYQPELNRTLRSDSVKRHHSTGTYKYIILLIVNK